MTDESLLGDHGGAMPLGAVYWCCNGERHWDLEQQWDHDWCRAGDCCSGSRVRTKWGTVLRYHCQLPQGRGRSLRDNSRAAPCGPRLKGDGGAGRVKKLLAALYASGVDIAARIKSPSWLTLSGEPMFAELDDSPRGARVNSTSWLTVV